MEPGLVLVERLEDHHLQFQRKSCVRNTLQSWGKKKMNKALLRSKVAQSTEEEEKKNRRILGSVMYYLPCVVGGTFVVCEF